MWALSFGESEPVAKSCGSLPVLKERADAACVPYTDNVSSSSSQEAVRQRHSTNMANLLPSSSETAGPSHSCPTRGHYNFRKPLHQSASCESCTSMLLLGGEPSAKREAPPSRKRKAQSSQEIAISKRNCDSPLSLSDQSTPDNLSQDLWSSPGVASDLVTSQLVLLPAGELLCDEDMLDEEVGRGHTEGPQSTSSSEHCEEWIFRPELLIPHLQETVPPAEYIRRSREPSNLSDSPTSLGEFQYQPVDKQFLVASMADMYGFSPLALSIGTSYFKRLAARDAALRKAALSSPDFSIFMHGFCLDSEPIGKSVGAPLHCCQTAREWLLAVHLTCVYVAAKNVEVVPYKHLLQTMLQNVHGLLVTPDQAAKLELEVLVGLKWRLGPFFLRRDC